jgi:hypothetical protein
LEVEMKNFFKNRRIWQLMLAVIMVVNLFSVAATPVHAGTCADYYLVQYGDTLYKIGLHYGMVWTNIADANGIGWPYTIYYGTQLCIPEGGSGNYDYDYNGYIPAGDYIYARVLEVSPNKEFTLKAYNLPKKEHFDVSVGKCDYSAATTVGEILTDGEPGNYTDTYKIPKKFKNVSCLVAYLDSTKTTRSTSVTFVNTSTGASSSTESSHLAFTIKDVRKNKTVTLRVTDFVKNEKYKIYIGNFATGAYPGTQVGTFKRENNQDFTITVNIPSAYRDATKLDIRIEGVTISASQYHSFKNKSS